MKSNKLVVLICTLLLFVWGLWRFWTVLNPFFAAIILAFLLSPLSSLLIKKLKFPRLLAILITIIILLSIIVLILSTVTSYAVRQMSSLASDLIKYASNYDRLVEDLGSFLASLHLPDEILSSLSNLLKGSDSYIASFLQSVISSIISFSAGLFDIIITLILTTYFMLDGSKIVKYIIGLFPIRTREVITRSLSKIARLTWRYFRTRVIISLGMGIVTYIGLLIMGIKYALLFAIISFILDFIPYFGSIIAGVIEIFYALISGSLGLAIAVAVFVIVVQQIEGNVVAPKIQGNATGIHPIVIMFALLACNQIWGPLGMLISTPIAIIFKTLFSEVHKYLVSDKGAEAV